MNSFNENKDIEIRSYIDVFSDTQSCPTYVLKSKHTLNSCFPEDVNSFLDVGCGPGFYSNDYVSILEKVVGLDLDPDIVKSFKGEKLIGSITNIPLPDRSFDYVCAIDVLEHLDSVELIQAVNELSRVSAKYLYIQVPNMENLHWGTVYCSNCFIKTHLNFHKNSFGISDLLVLFEKEWTPSLINLTGDVYPSNYTPNSFSNLLTKEGFSYNPFVVAKCPKCHEKLKQNDEYYAEMYNKWCNLSNIDELYPCFSEISVLFEKKKETPQGKLFKINASFSEVGSDSKKGTFLFPSKSIGSFEMCPSLYTADFDYDGDGYEYAFTPNESLSHNIFVHFSPFAAYKGEFSFLINTQKKIKFHVFIKIDGGEKLIYESENIGERLHIININNSKGDCFYPTFKFIISHRSHLILKQINYNTYEENKKTYLVSHKNPNNFFTCKYRGNTVRFFLESHRSYVFHEPINKYLDNMFCIHKNISLNCVLQLHLHSLDSALFVKYAEIRVNNLVYNSLSHQYFNVFIEKIALQYMVNNIKSNLLINYIKNNLLINRVSRNVLLRKQVMDVFRLSNNSNRKNIFRNIVHSIIKNKLTFSFAKNAVYYVSLLINLFSKRQSYLFISKCKKVAKKVLLG